jgi:putative transposase
MGEAIWHLLGVHPTGQAGTECYIERFNGTFRDEVLDANSFASLEQARSVSNEWLHVYNEQRAHRSLGKLPPKEFKARWQQQQSLLRAGSA